MMATSRSVQKEIESLRQEIADLRKDYARLKGRAKATANDGLERAGAIREELAATIDAIKERVADGTGAAADEISAQLEELCGVANEYTEKTERTVAAHPLATLAGAIAVGYLIGRLGR